jgi:hypothetical protein
MAMTPESKAKAQIKTFLKSLTDCFFFSPIGGPFATHGIPDIVVCLKGRFVGIEVKRPGNEQGTTPLQDLALQRITASGGLAFVASNVTTVKTQLYLAGLYVP